MTKWYPPGLTVFPADCERVKRMHTSLVYSREYMNYSVEEGRLFKAEWIGTALQTTFILPGPSWPLGPVI